MTTRECDIAIVGSGAAGGVLAERLSTLCSRGARILLLEAGPYYRREFFNQREADMTTLFWERGAFYTRDGAISIAMGRCVGGGTTVYTGVSFRTPEEVLEAWRRDDSLEDIAASDFIPRFERLERELNVREFPESEVNENNRLFRAGCESLRWKWKHLKLAATADCNGCGFCNLGCWNGSKQTTLEVHIPRALKQGVELLADCHVDRVEKNRVFAHISEPAPGHYSQAPVGPVEIRARLILLAAGAIHSPAILMRSRLGLEGDVLGKFVTLHPALTLHAIHPHPVCGHAGFPKTFYVDDFADSHDYLLETAFYFPGVTAKNIVGFGQDHREMMKQYTHFQSLIVLHLDAAREENQVRLRGGKPVLDYRMSPQTIQSLTHAMQSSARLFFEAGASKVMIPAAPRALERERDARHIEQMVAVEHFLPQRVPVASAHPQGGCRMGSRPEVGIVNSYGQVHGHPWLFVCDASIFPASVRVNPFMTIMAFADRTAEHIVDNISRWL